MLALAAPLVDGSAAAEPNGFVWQSLDALPDGDRSYAQTALYDFWGDNPDLWPDWIDPVFIRVPAGTGRNILIVRQPLRQPCGEYGYTVLGPVTPEGARAMLGERFCGGDLQLAPGPSRGGLPDIVVGESREQDGEGEWRSLPPSRWRWTDGAWQRMR